MNVLIEDHLETISTPANLRINDQINAFRAECAKSGCVRPYHHFAFGESPFSPPPTVVEALAANAAQHSYLPTGGMVALRDRIAEYYRSHFDLDCDGSQVVVGPGSKEMLSITLAVLQGAVIVPTPSWVSYLPQAKILKKEVVGLRVSREEGFKLTPDLLSRGLDEAQSDQKILVLNHPNNPTGAIYTEGELKDIAAVCRKHDVLVISDEIYAQTTFEMNQFTSMGKVFPEGTIITGGLSKDRSCGGYRLGVAVYPKEPKELTSNVLKVAGSTYSCVAAPIQYAAMEAYSGNEQVETHIRACTKIHALAGRKTSALLSEIEGVQTTIPSGAFYLYVDFNEQREQFEKLGFETCADFCENLLTQEHTALLPGSALLLPENDFSVRLSYVDYDGDTALAKWRKTPPTTAGEEDAFVEDNFPLMTQGVASIGRYLEAVRQGKQPEHSDRPQWYSKNASE